MEEPKGGSRDESSGDAGDSSSSSSDESSESGVEVAATAPDTAANESVMMSGTVTETTEISKAVTWPPSTATSGTFSSLAASRYMKLVDQSTSQTSHSQYTLSRELFKPGKLNEERWKESTAADQSEPTVVRNRRGFRKLDDFLHTDENGPTKMPSYHVPPGTTRTRKAQENYQKHLAVDHE